MPGSAAANVAALTPGAVMPGTFMGQKSASMYDGFSADMETPTGTPTSSTHVQPTKLFIGGISRRTTTKQLRDHFSKSGRVLDCVAMRTPDGRPRGFGYVTLDSPAAAERFLADPQVIDDRIVDMKRAVPEALTSKAASGQLMSTGMSDPSLSMQALYAQHGMFSTWPDYSAMCCDNAYGSIGMTDGIMQSSMSDPAMDCLLNQGGTGPLLPDCVDLLTGSLLDGMGYPAVQEGSCDAEEESLAAHYFHTSSSMLGAGLNGESFVPRKNPLAEVTNVFSNNSPSNAVKKPCLAPLAEAAVEHDTTKPYQRIGLNSGVVKGSTPLSASAPCFIYEDPQAGTHEEGYAESTEPPSPAGEADLSPQAPSFPSPAGAELTADETSPSAELSAEGLPSLGSAQHASGECRRCNFFAKGRCRNGFNCSFCHLPHDRRKLSRQEKRDQKAARALTGASSDNDSDSASEAEIATGPLLSLQSGPLLSPSNAAAPPGLALDATEKPSEEHSVTAPLLSTTTATGAPLPPGLRPPGLPAPESRQDNSVACQPQPTPAGRLFPWEPSNGGIFATSPCSSVSGASSLLLSTTPAAPVLQPAKTNGKEFRSIETQTDDDYTCPYCEDCGEGLVSCAARCTECDA
jgi:hypothetical protein